MDIHIILKKEIDTSQMGTFTYTPTGLTQEKEVMTSVLSREGNNIYYEQIYRDKSGHSNLKCPTSVHRNQNLVCTISTTIYPQTRQLEDSAFYSLGESSNIKLENIKKLERNQTEIIISRKEFENKDTISINYAPLGFREYESSTDIILIKTKVNINDTIYEAPFSVSIDDKYASFEYDSEEIGFKRKYLDNSHAKSLSLDTNQGMKLTYKNTGASEEEQINIVCPRSVPGNTVYKCKTNKEGEIKVEGGRIINKNFGDDGVHPNNVQYLGSYLIKQDLEQLDETGEPIEIHAGQDYVTTTNKEFYIHFDEGPTFAKIEAKFKDKKGRRCYNENKS